jgi:DNA-binding NarL/FixJ family response regulator
LKRIRVLLAKMPPLMLDILHHVVAAEPDMAVVGVVGDGNVSAAIRRTRADVVVLEQDAQGERDFYVQLWRRHPHIKVLAISDSGKRGWLYELRPRCIPLGKISACSLVAAIQARTALGPAPTSRKKRAAEVH